MAFQGIPPLGIRIKWPNDLYLDELKVGGILCTSTYNSKKFNVSVGKYSFFFMIDQYRNRTLPVSQMSYIKFLSHIT